MKQPANFRLTEDTLYVLRRVAAEHGVSQAEIVDRALHAELARMIAGGKPVDLRKTYDGKVAKSAKFGR